MSYKYTAEQLLSDRERFRSTQEQARDALTEIRDMFDRLLAADSTDAERARIVNKLEKRLTLGYANIKNVAVWSKIANESDEGRARRKEAQEKFYQEHEEKCRLEREEMARVKASGESICNLCKMKVYNARTPEHMKHLHGIDI